MPHHAMLHMHSDPSVSLQHHHAKPDSSANLHTKRAHSERHVTGSDGTVAKTSESEAQGIMMSSPVPGPPSGFRRINIALNVAANATAQSLAADRDFPARLEAGILNAFKHEQFEQKLNPKTNPAEQLNDQNLKTGMLMGENNAQPPSAGEVTIILSMNVPAKATADIVVQDLRKDPGAFAQIFHRIANLIANPNKMEKTRSQMSKTVEFPPGEDSEIEQMEERVWGAVWNFAVSLLPSAGAVATDVVKNLFDPLECTRCNHWAIDDFCSMVCEKLGTQSPDEKCVILADIVHDYSKWASDYAPCEEYRACDHQVCECKDHVVQNQAFGHCGFVKWTQSLEPLLLFGRDREIAYRPASREEVKERIREEQKAYLEGRTIAELVKFAQDNGLDDQSKGAPAARRASKEEWVSHILSNTGAHPLQLYGIPNNHNV